MFLVGVDMLLTLQSRSYKETEEATAEDEELEDEDGEGSTG